MRRCRGHAPARAVHRLRVETRRLLAQLVLLTPQLTPAVVEAGRRALRKQLKSLSDLRDLHVMMKHVEALLPRHPLLRDFGRHLREREPAAVRLMECRLGRKKYGRLIQALEKELTGFMAGSAMPDRRFQASVRRTLDDSLTRLVRRKQKARDDLPALHKLRVALKQHRYLAEALGVERSAKASAQLDRMRAWQGGMGAILDLALLEEQLRRFVGRAGRRVRYQPVLTALARRRARLVETLPGMSRPQLRISF